MNKIQRSHSRKGQGWIQTWGGVTILFILPAIASLYFFPTIQLWIRSTFLNARPASANAVQAAKSATRSPAAEQRRLRESILKIAEVSKAEPDIVRTGSTSPSELSHAVQHLYRALEAHPDWKAKDVLDAANHMRLTADPAPCPFEWIHGEGSVVLSDQTDGKISLIKTLNRCTEAVKQVAFPGH